MIQKEISIQYTKSLPDPKIKFSNVKAGKIMTILLEEGDNEEIISKTIFKKLKREVNEELLE